MRTPLSRAIVKAITTTHATIAEAAAASGINEQKLRDVIAGRLRPNATTIPRYAKLVGASESDVQEMLRPGTAKGKAPTKQQRVVIDIQAKSIAECRELLERAERLLSDPLAASVHGLEPGARKVMGTIIRSLA